MMQSLSVAHALCISQDGRCFHCGVEFRGPWRSSRKTPLGWTKDHIVPVSEGGLGPLNIVISCAPCNNKRHCAPFTPEQIARARALHAAALRMAQFCNGGIPPEWAGRQVHAHEKEAARVVAERNGREMGYRPELLGGGT